MKTKVVIENLEITIILTPENDFERDIIEEIENKREKFTLHTSVNVLSSYGSYSKHNIELSIKQEK